MKAIAANARWRSLTAALAAVLSVMAMLSGPLAPSAVAGTGPLANPPANIAAPFYSVDTGECSEVPAQAPKCPSPCYPHGKLVYNDSPSCAGLLLAGINAAQKAEGKAQLMLPSNYFSLPPADQMFVVVNLERLSRGVPALMGLAPSLDAAAVSGARRAEDPIFSPTFGPVKVWYPPNGGRYGFGGTWAGNAVNVLAAIFGWMYDDGWGGNRKDTYNFLCTSATSSECWGHRDILLGEATGTTCTTCIAGSAYVTTNIAYALRSYDFLIVRPQAPVALSYTWAGELKYLPAGWERTPA